MSGRFGFIVSARPDAASSRVEDVFELRQSAVECAQLLERDGFVDVECYEIVRRKLIDFRGIAGNDARSTA